MPGEAGQIGRIDDLGMLDPPATVAFIGGGKLVDRVEHGGVGLIADRMDRDLEMVHRRPAHHILERGVADQRKAALARRVAIGLLQPGAARAERAVQIELHADHAQPPVIEPGRRPGAGDGEQVVDPRGVGEDADAQGARVPGAAHHRPILGARPHVGDGGEAVGKQYLLRGGERAVALSGERGGDGALQQRHGGVDEDPVRGIAGPLDPAAARRLRLGGDPGLAHRHRVRPAGMAVDPLQPDRPVAHGGVEIGGGGEAAQAPALLVPAAADDPARGRVGGGIGADPRLRLGQRIGVAEIERERAHAEAHDMAVRVDQAGDEGAAAAVDPVGAAPLRPPLAAPVELRAPCRRRRPACALNRASRPSAPIV